MKRPRMLVATMVVAVAAVAAGCVVSDDAGQRTGSAGMMGRSTDVGEADYLAEMVAHHREAVAAARELARSDRAEMRAFGESIVATQSAQIEQMVIWLGDWYPDQDAAVDYQPMMRDLTGLSGDDLDRVFLQDMVGHHMAAVMMSQQLLVAGRRPRGGGRPRPIDPRRPAHRDRADAALAAPVVRHPLDGWAPGRARVTSFPLRG